MPRVVPSHDEPELSMTSDAQPRSDPSDLEVIYLQLVNTSLTPTSLLPGKTGSQPLTTYYTAEIPNYTCNNANGLTCYGAPAPGGQGFVFPRGEACPVGECCGTIVDGTSAQAPCRTPPPRPPSAATSRCACRAAAPISPAPSTASRSVAARRRCARAAST